MVVDPDPPWEIEIYDCRLPERTSASAWVHKNDVHEMGSVASSVVLVCTLLFLNVSEC